MSDLARLLVVDDDAELRELLDEYLSQQGFEVVTVEDGAAMDAYLGTATADLVILDLMLPGEDGLSIAKRLKRASDIPIIMVSARSECTSAANVAGSGTASPDAPPPPSPPKT